MDRLFVYGIFLNDYNREAYGMSNEAYATVKDFLTVGDRIVEAVYVPDVGLALTGLTVDVDPTHWDDIDRLESNYDRVIVSTTGGEKLNMYTRKGTYGQTLNAVEQAQTS